MTRPFGRRGNVAIMTALLAIPILGLAGLAVDFGQVTTLKAQFDGAADAAALVATTTASNAYLAGSADPVTPAKAAGQQRFLAEAGAQWDQQADTVTVAVTQQGTLFSSNVKYSGIAKTTLSNIVGVSTLPLAGESVASITVSPYVDIQILMDASSSMAIAATDADIAKMKTLTAAYAPDGSNPNVSRGEQCAFACHWTTTKDDYFALANRNDVQLRINVLRNAVGNLISTITTLNKNSHFRIGLYTFAQSLTPIYAVSSDLSSATLSLPKIVPDVNLCTSNCPDTDVAGAISSLAAATGVSGDGTTQAKSQKFLFVVSDGVIDATVKGSRVMRPVAASDCQPIKALGVTIMTLYTPYLQLRDNDFYNTYIYPFNNQIGPGLQSCASNDTLYYQATDSSDINGQLQKMLASVLQTTGHFTK